MMSFKQPPAVEQGEATGPLSHHVESAELDFERRSRGSDEPVLAFLSAARNQPEAGATVSIEALRAALDNDARAPGTRRSREAS